MQSRTMAVPYVVVLERLLVRVGRWRRLRRVSDRRHLPLLDDEPTLLDTLDRGELVEQKLTIFR